MQNAIPPACTKLASERKKEKISTSQYSRRTTIRLHSGSSSTLPALPRTPIALQAPGCFPKKNRTTGGGRAAISRKERISSACGNPGTDTQIPPRDSPSGTTLYSACSRARGITRAGYRERESDAIIPEDASGRL